MSRETLAFIVLYYGLTTVIGGLVMARHFVRLQRDALAGAFSGFGAAMVGFGIPGLALLWQYTPCQTAWHGRHR